MPTREKQWFFGVLGASLRLHLLPALPDTSVAELLLGASVSLWLTIA